MKALERLQGTTTMWIMSYPSAKKYKETLERPKLLSLLRCFELLELFFLDILPNKADYDFSEQICVIVVVVVCCGKVSAPKLKDIYRKYIV